MKSIASIDLSFENFEYVRIYWQGIYHMVIKGLEYHSYRFSNDLTQAIMGSDIKIVLIKDLLQKPELFSDEGMHNVGGEDEDLISNIEMHLGVWRDITSIEINYEDGTEDSFRVLWHEGVEPDVNLYQKFDTSSPDEDVLTITANNYTG